MTRVFRLSALIFLVGLAGLALAQERVREERSVLVPARDYQSSQERVASRLRGAGEAPRPAQDIAPNQLPPASTVPLMERTPGREIPQFTVPQPPVASPDLSTRRARGRSAEPQEAPRFEPQLAEPQLAEPRLAAEPRVVGEPRVAAVPTQPVPAQALAPRNPPSQQAPAQQAQQMTIKTLGPSLQIDATGPRSVVLGKAAMYRVRAANLGQQDAQNVLVRIALPRWVDVLGGQPTSGEAQRVTDPDGEGTVLTWSIDLVPAGGQQQFDVKVVPRESTPFNMQLEWTLRPVGGVAQIVVRQPQLAVQIEGPSEVLFGSTTAYRVSISNPGTGAAENVTLHVTTGEGVQSKQFNAIGPGGRETVELELVAREAGELTIQAAAVGDADLAVETEKKVLIRRAKLEVAVTGPQQRFAGQEAVYRLDVKNVGDAPADDLVGAVTLPTGGEYQGGLEGPQIQGGRVAWRIAALAPGAQRSYQVRTTLPLPGEHNVVAQIASNGVLMADGGCVTQVEAIADLKLSINDPRGPVPTGKDAIYEVKVTNRGSRAAENVKVVAQFSEGIEPVGFEGADAELVPGQVLFQVIPKLAGGETLVLKIVARASEGGTHRFRVVVTCSDQESQHSAEETTRYFRGDDAGAAAVPAPPALGNINPDNLEPPAFQP